MLYRAYHRRTPTQGASDWAPGVADAAEECGSEYGPALFVRRVDGAHLSEDEQADEEDGWKQDGDLLAAEIERQRPGVYTFACCGVET